MDSPPATWSLTRETVGVALYTTEAGVLRLGRSDPDAAVRLGKQFGFPWPMLPNTVAGMTARAAWQAPGEWMVFGPPESVAAGIAKACGGHLHHWADVSAGHSLWRLWGGTSRDLIAQSCSLDLHPRVFSPGCCARTLFAGIPALILAGDTPGTFDILADASYDDYLQAWFANALHND